MKKCKWGYSRLIRVVLGIVPKRSRLSLISLDISINKEGYMNHWGWYWYVKGKGHPQRRLCSGVWLCKIDSVEMYNRYYQVEAVRSSSSKKALEIPQYGLTAYLQEDDSLWVEHNEGSYKIPVEKMACNFGGHTHYFRCPLCDKRMRKLYCINGQYQCRKCGNLAYYTQRLRPS